jgi:uncharacterized membrane protein YfcA
VTIYALILICGLASGCLSGIVGTGAGVILLPILVFEFGPQQAVPIMAIAGVMGNIAKVASWWHDVKWRGFLAYSIPGAIGAALGANTLLILPPETATAFLGVFFLLMIPAHRILEARGISIGLAGLGVAGFAIGFLSGIALTTGPISIPVFAAFGLSKGALISTEAASALVVSVGKIAAFYQAGALPLPILTTGLLVGASVMAGALIGRSLLLRMSTRAFEIALDAMLFVAGVSMLWAALA